jgi:hypothetical protein
MQALYVNGAQVALGTTPISVGYDSHPLTIGAEYENNVLSFFFPGRVDECSLYNRALSPAEIQGIFNADSAGKCQGAANERPVAICQKS